MENVSSAANVCRSVDTPEFYNNGKKIKAVGGQALLILSAHHDQVPRRDVKPAADFIGSELANCFQPKEKQKAQAGILELMRQAVCREGVSGLPEEVLKKVDIQDVNQVSRYLGNQGERLSCQ